MRLNKSFARRVGRAMSANSKRILETTLPSKTYNLDKVTLTNYDKIYLEIGFGAGEYFVHQTLTNPQNLYIGVEVYLNGVASCLKKLLAEQVNNYLLWADDLDLILPQIRNHSLHNINILFPDPWPKKRYIKKRLFNQERLNILKTKLVTGGKIFFASDIEDYFTQAKLLFERDTDFYIEPAIIESNFLIPPENYIETRYHRKAIQAGRIVKFLIAQIN